VATIQLSVILRVHGLLLDSHVLISGGTRAGAIDSIQMQEFLEWWELNKPKEV
jgi:hypothetical protein